MVAQVFPFNGYDRLFFMGITGEVWMEPGVTRDGLAATQAVVYRDKGHAGQVALVLGAGNVASIGPMDVLYKLFVEDQVVVLKMNPVNEYLGPLIEEGFRALVEPGYLRVVYGGAAAEGAYLCQHPLVEEIHITGSDKTFDAIVFGTGPEGAARKASGQPLLTKPISGELGNVEPGDRRAGAVERARPGVSGGASGHDAGEQRRLQLQRHTGDCPARGMAAARGAAGRGGGRARADSGAVGLLSGRTAAVQ